MFYTKLPLSFFLYKTRKGETKNIYLFFFKKQKKQKSKRCLFKPILSVGVGVRRFSSEDAFIACISCTRLVPLQTPSPQAKKGALALPRVPK
jgi:hypothetical protein